MTTTPSTASSTRALAAKVLYTTLDLLDKAGGTLQRIDIIRKLPELLDLNEWESARTGKRQNERWRNALWYTTDAARAGFLRKRAGKWSITEEGREALELSPEELLDAAINGYNQWQADRNADEEESSGRYLGAWARSQILRDGLQLLGRAPGKSMAVPEFLRRLPTQLPEDLLEALEAYSADWVENYGYRTFYRPSRAGWIHRSAGTWTLTESGQRALQEFPDAKHLWDTAKQLMSGEREEDEKLPYLGALRDYQAVPPAVYRSANATIGQLVGDIQQGTLALPDIQRPFVWKNTKVRDLLDSMFSGYPFGYILTWRSPSDAGVRQIGTDSKGHVLPHALVIDGQQRLTSLYTVMTGEPVLDANFRKRRVRIAFHPIQGGFEVADAARDKNPEWMSDISKLFTSEQGPYAVSREYIERLRASREVEDPHLHAAENNIQRLANLRNTQTVVLEIDSNADEEQVAEIFVRINSKGQNLKQADFILTLLAVFWEEGREQLEEFARSCRVPSGDHTPSPFNRQLQPGADDLVRVVVAVGHRRARLSAAYQVLRGKDPERGVVTPEARDKNLRILEEAQNRALDLGNWHEFLKALSAAGYRGASQIQSMNNALYAYAFFLLGREQYGLGLDELRSLIGRWFMMSVITGRYVGGSMETAMEEDLARLRGIAEGDSEGFRRALGEAMAAELTNDFWELTLPSRLESSSIRSAYPFFAAQSVLGTKALFSSLSVSELLDPLKVANKKDLEVHHLFPKNWLRKHGHDNAREYNQVANYALLEWSDNISVSDQAPSEYAPERIDRMSEGERETAMTDHALPERWWELEYDEFLPARRDLMARVIRRAFERLALL